MGRSRVSFWASFKSKIPNIALQNTHFGAPEREVQTHKNGINNQLVRPFIRSLSTEMWADARAVRPYMPRNNRLVYLFTCPLSTKTLMDARAVRPYMPRNNQLVYLFTCPLSTETLMDARAVRPYMHSN